MLMLFCKNSAFSRLRRILPIPPCTEKFRKCTKTLSKAQLYGSNYKTNHSFFVFVFVFFFFLKANVDSVVLSKFRTLIPKATQKMQEIPSPGIVIWDHNKKQHRFPRKVENEEVDSEVFSKFRGILPIPPSLTTLTSDGVNTKNSRMCTKTHSKDQITTTATTTMPPLINDVNKRNVTGITMRWLPCHDTPCVATTLELVLSSAKGLYEYVSVCVFYIQESMCV